MKHSQKSVGAGVCGTGGWRPPPTHGVPVRPRLAPGVLRPSGWGGPGARLGFDMGVESFAQKCCRWRTGDPKLGL